MISSLFVESYLRRTIKPLEALLTSHKRLVVKDSAVSIAGFDSDHLKHRNKKKWRSCLQYLVVSHPASTV